MNEKKTKTYNAATHNAPRLCGWSNQGDERQDREAMEIHKRWIRRSGKR
jgi:hypothetical protein